jgi:hypothetical protein
MPLWIELSTKISKVRQDRYAACSFQGRASPYESAVPWDGPNGRRRARLWASGTHDSTSKSSPAGDQLRVNSARDFANFRP